MPLEQTYPNKPNFLKVVLLSAGAILLVFLIILACVGFDGKRLIPHSFTKTNTSQLVLPSVSTTWLV